MARDLGLLLAALAAGTLLALVLSAVNLGAALTFGQIAFVATLTYVLVQGRR